MTEIEKDTMERAREIYRITLIDPERMAIGAITLAIQEERDRQVEKFRTIHEEHFKFREALIEIQKKLGIEKSVVEAYRNKYERECRLVDELVGVLEEYGSHSYDCVRSLRSAGEPTKDGGYRERFGDKWYESRPIDKTPKCNCGFDEALESVRKARGK